MLIAELSVGVQETHQTWVCKGNAHLSVLVSSIFMLHSQTYKASSEEINHSGIASVRVVMQPAGRKCFA